MRYQCSNCGYSMWDEMIMEMQKPLCDMPPWSATVDEPEQREESRMKSYETLEFTEIELEERKVDQ